MSARTWEEFIGKYFTEESAAASLAAYCERTGKVVSIAPYHMPAQGPYLVGYWRAKVATPEGRTGRVVFLGSWKMANGWDDVRRDRRRADRLRRWIADNAPKVQGLAALEVIAERVRFALYLDKGGAL